MSILAKVKEATNKVVDSLLVIKNAENDVETSKKKIEELKNAIEAEKLVLDTRKSSLNTAKSNLLGTLDEIKEGGLNERQIKLAATQLFEAWVENGLINTEEEKVIEKKEVVAEKVTRVRKPKVEVTVVPAGGVTVTDTSEKAIEAQDVDALGVGTPLSVEPVTESTEPVAEEVVEAETEKEIVVTVSEVVSAEIASEETKEETAAKEDDEEVSEPVVETAVAKPVVKNALLDDDDEEDLVTSKPALSSTTIRPKVPSFIKK